MKKSDLDRLVHALTYLLAAEERRVAGQPFMAINLTDKATAIVTELVAAHHGETPNTVRMRVEAELSRQLYPKHAPLPTLCTTGERRP